MTVQKLAFFLALEPMEVFDLYVALLVVVEIITNLLKSSIMNFRVGGFLVTR
jgi:hypothetical protein